MNVSELGDHFEVAEYQPDKQGNATVELINGTIRVRIPYFFHSTGGTASALTMVDGEATAQQLTDLKTILAAVLQATNTGIETTYGWTKYIDPSP